MEKLKESARRLYRFVLILRAHNQLSRLSNEADVASKQLAEALRETFRNTNASEERAWIQRIEALRAELNSTTTEISITDYGAGSPECTLTGDEMYQGRATTTTVGEVTRVSSKSYLWTLLLFKLVRKFKPSVCLELGTSVGISASYQAAALKLNQAGKIVTLEGAESLATLARQNFQRLALNNVVTIIGRFQETLEDVLYKYKPIDFVFIDGHHDEQATLTYFENIYPSLSDGAVLIFDDISWSEGMKRAWSTIIADERIGISVDLSRVGICITNGSIGQRKNLRIRMI
jgi:predicted O-methyltransferase YrrM